MANTYENVLELDVRISYQTQRIRAKQQDSSSRTLNIYFKKDGIRYVPESGTTVHINIKRPDGKKLVGTCSLVGSGESSHCVYVLTNEDLAVNGILLADVSLINGISVLKTESFEIDVDESPEVKDAELSAEQQVLIHDMATLKSELAEANTSSIKVRQQMETATAQMNTVAQQVSSKADEAGKSAKNASFYAETAVAKATEAGTKASEASTSATQAGKSATAAAGSQTEAKKSETAAASSANSASSSASTAGTKATEAGAKAAEASSSAKLSRSYATGDTNSRTGEATDNAKYYKEQAASSANAASTQASTAASQATTATQKANTAATSASQASGSAAAAAGSAAAAAESAKQAKAAVGTIPSAESIAKLQTDKLDKAGDAKDTTVSFAEAASLVNVNTGEKASVLWGKVKKAISTLISHISTMASATVAGHVKFGSAAGTACQGNDGRLSNARTPTAHAHAVGATYGMGTNTVYGHVKLSDAYETNNGAASSGIGASQNALYSAYVNLNDKNNAVNTRVTSLEAGREDYKQWIPTFGTTTRLIPNALYVDINTANGDMNKVGYVVAGNTTNMPSGCYYGIREAYFFNTTNVWVKIMGVNSNGDYAEWVNVYNGTIWRGWSVTSMSYI